MLSERQIPKWSEIRPLLRAKHFSLSATNGASSVR